MRVDVRIGATWFIGLALVLASLGCPGGDGAPDDAGSDSRTASCAGPTDTLDLLFVIENAGGVSEEQASLLSQLPHLLEALTTGELRDASGAIVRSGTAATSLHVGVVTSDMGVGDAAVPTCDDPRFGDDGVLWTRGALALRDCSAGYPSFLEFATGDDVASVTTDLTCVLAGVGTDGCGFERHLGAMLKALTPSDSDIVFQAGTGGHADRENAGFLRPDSVLAIVLLAEEDDCDAARADLYNPSSTTYAGDLGMRCADYPEALHPISYYLDGLLALRPDHPERIVYAPIAGVPTDLVADPDDIDYAAILDDPRMQQRPNPAMPSGLTPSCNVPGRGLAFPPVRIATLARELDAAGAHAVMQSYCQEDYTGPIDAIVGRIFDALAGGCAR
ncbi:MAG: hypothetical protein GXP55_10195 [Deltaproteobacteria bacterium]|nr:hypothetical protein [Deltaproteobacteria bacterium]